jgi:hypothetical protein
MLPPVDASAATQRARPAPPTELKQDYGSREGDWHADWRGRLCFMTEKCQFRRRLNVKRASSVRSRERH